METNTGLIFAEVSVMLKMRNVQRLSTSTKLRSYNNLEHSFGVLYLFILFAKVEGIAIDSEVMELVLKHDLLESETGDLLYTVKNLNRNTRKAWQNIEDEVVIQEGKQFLQMFTDDAIQQKMRLDQLKLLNACDLLDLWIFCKQETMLGNYSTRIKDILQRCSDFLIDPVSTLYFGSITQFMNRFENLCEF